MANYPANLVVRGRRCLVLGGGEVAERKTLGLLVAGAEVSICSPVLTAKLRELAARGEVIHINSIYRPEIIGKFFIVICATDDHSVNQEAAREAQRKGALANVVDDPEISDFTVPASVIRGDLVVTVSTNGKSPILARRLREELAGLYGPEYGVYLEIVAKIRAELKELRRDGSYRQSFWRETLNAEIINLLREGKLDQAEERIRSALKSDAR